MLLIDQKGRKHKAQVCPKPKMSCRRGRTWDMEHKEVDNEKREFWCDTTWGKNYYFQMNGKWYRIPFLETSDSFVFQTG